MGACPDAEALEKTCLHGPEAGHPTPHPAVGPVRVALPPGAATAWPAPLLSRSL